MAPPPTLLISLLLLLSVSPTTVFSLTTPDLQTECLSVTSAVFSTSVKAVIDQIHNVLSLVSNFAPIFNDFRLSNAINDCTDLLDFSADELTLTLADDTANPKAGTGRRGSDMKSWLSAALGNQDTCLDGFDGTDGIAKSLVAGGLTQVTSMIEDVLQMVRQVPGRKFSGRGSGLPDWMTVGHRRLLQASVPVDATVAADGTGNFTTVMEAVLAAPDNSERRYVIYIKRGVYKENVEIKKKKWNVMMMGEGMGVTVISGNRNYVDGWTTFRSATFAVSGRGFIARDMTFENTAGPQKHQAVALRSDSDLSAFYRCSISGYQDTLYAHSLRQFYRECRISGTVDFIFGNGAVVFQNCQIFARKPLPDQKNSITAQGRKDPNQNTGFSIQYSNITADSDLLTSSNSTPTYLGRPWKEYSRTVFMQSYIGGVIRPEGWLAWQGDFALNTLYYGEYMNYGPGATLGARVKWPGFHVITDSSQASNFTVVQFIDGNLWLPSTGVKYTAGPAM
ncbi:pectinesterase/pectinesterase inhibitor PPE8B-like [Tasmannia lanceolata]|uniref:pectinesterase/pectinesterase inhibitor PPE8B-like n=1 Tax=Tasmannia lanceolata TaxID=3420 RepID=UPI004063302B